jgi:glutamyl-tRNA reductase
MEARNGRPLLLIDIAVPRDIHPRVAELEGVVLRDIDDLQRVIERNLSGREAEARRAESLIDHELARFTRWLDTLAVVPTIAALRGRAEAVVRELLEENEGRWESLGEADRKRLEQLAGTIAKRLLDEPIRRLRAREHDQATYAYVQALRELFGLDVETATAFGERVLGAGEGRSRVTPLRRGSARRPARRRRGQG